MAILPITGANLGLKNNSISFGAKTDERENYNEVPQRRISNKLATVPVVVLMAMTPSMLNANGNRVVEALNTSGISELVEKQSAPKSESATYVMAPEQSRPMTAGQKRYFDDFKDQIPLKMQAYNGAYVAFRRINNFIFGIDYIPRDVNYKGGIDEIMGTHNDLTVPSAVELEYHDTGDGKEFLGLKVRALVQRNGKDYYKDEEVKVPTDVANKIISLLNNEYEYKNRTGLKVRMLNTSTLLPTTYTEPHD